MDLINRDHLPNPVLLAGVSDLGTIGFYLTEQSVVTFTNHGFREHQTLGAALRAEIGSNRSDIELTSSNFSESQLVALARIVLNKNKGDIPVRLNGHYGVFDHGRWVPIGTAAKN